MGAGGHAGSCTWRRCVGQRPSQALGVHRGCGEPPRADWRDSFGRSGGWCLGRWSSGRICENRFSIARRAESPRDATEGRCWVEPSTADSSIRPRLARARSKGPGPAASAGVAWSSGSTRAVGVARPASRGACSGGISVRQRPGEARDSANESCRRGFREIPQKPSVFAPDEILASDRAGGLYRTDGTFIRKLEDGPVQVSEATRIYDAEHSPAGDAWVWDMHLDKAGNPVIAYSSHPKNIADNRYRYARWNGKSWEDRQIAFGGKRVTIDANLPQGNFYAGGICLDPDDLKVVYVSSSVNVRDGTPNKSRYLEIYRGVTANGGRDWKWTPLTKNSTVENLRPIVPSEHPGKTFVLWFRGDYPAYKKFNTEVVAYIDARLPAVTRRVTWGRDASGGA